MTYEPNVDAAVHFVEDVFPRIRAVHPDVQLRIVGRCDTGSRSWTHTGT